MVSVVVAGCKRLEDSRDLLPLAASWIVHSCKRLLAAVFAKTRRDAPDTGHVMSYGDGGKRNRRETVESCCSRRTW